MKLMKLLVAFDGTDYSVLALDEAARRAAADGAEITVLSVIAPDARGSKSGGHVGAPPHADADIAFARTYFEERGLDVVAKVAHGDPAEEIVAAARAGEFDAIVVGTRELGPVGRLLGSVSRKVIHRAPCPVVVVGKEGVQRIEPGVAAPA